MEESEIRNSERTEIRDRTFHSVMDHESIREWEEEIVNCQVKKDLFEKMASK